MQTRRAKLKLPVVASSNTISVLPSLYVPVNVMTVLLALRGLYKCD